MSQQELLIKVIETLESAGIEYMVTGSIVSSLQGEPRSTHDVDIVVIFKAPDIKSMLDAFREPDYYIDEEDIKEAITRKSMFNLIDANSGDKVDFWLFTGDAFDRSRFARKYSENIMNINIMVSSPEDTILAKLRWAKLSGGSDKQFTDALRVFEVQMEKLDLGYIREWAKELDVGQLLDQIQEEAGRI